MIRQLVLLYMLRNETTLMGDIDIYMCIFRMMMMRLIMKGMIMAMMTQ